jgi:hypothetical protein
MTNCFIIPTIFEDDPIKFKKLQKFGVDGGFLSYKDCCKFYLNKVFHNFGVINPDVRVLKCSINTQQKYINIHVYPNSVRYSSVWCNIHGRGNGQNNCDNFIYNNANSFYSLSSMIGFPYTSYRLYFDDSDMKIRKKYIKFAFHYLRHSNVPLFIANAFKWVETDNIVSKKKFNINPFTKLNINKGLLSQLSIVEYLIKPAINLNPTNSQHNKYQKIWNVIKNYKI